MDARYTVKLSPRMTEKFSRNSVKITKYQFNPFVRPSSLPRASTNKGLRPFVLPPPVSRCSKVFPRTDTVATTPFKSTNSPVRVYTRTCSSSFAPPAGPKHQRRSTQPAAAVDAKRDASADIRRRRSEMSQTAGKLTPNLGTRNDMRKVIHRVKQLSESKGERLGKSIKKLEGFIDGIEPKNPKAVFQEIALWKQLQKEKEKEQNKNGTLSANTSINADKATTPIVAKPVKESPQPANAGGVVERIIKIAQNDLLDESELAEPVHIKSLLRSGAKEEIEKLKEKLHASEKAKLDILYEGLEFEKNERKHKIKRAIGKLANSLTLVSRLVRMYKATKDKLSVPDFIDAAFPSHPFQSPEAEDFMRLSMIGDVDRVTQMISKNRFLVYEFDYVGRTSLHHAARRNMCHLMEVLLRELADPNACDVSGRTPLYVAAKYASVGAVKILIQYRASLYYCSRSGERPMDVARNDAIKLVLRTAIKTYNDMRAYKDKQVREHLWQTCCNMYFKPSTKDMEMTD